jgi:uncharacterized protein (DUF1800 family)
MAIMSVRSHIAPIRFGLGLRLGEAAPADPLAWLEAQLGAQPAAAPSVTASDALLARTIHIVLRDEGLGTRESRAPQLRAALERRGTPIPERSPLPPLIRRETLAWAAQRLTTATPFRERLVDFWANHFTTARRGGAMSILPAALEQEAIRPHLTGRFADMLVAVTRHPAMLIYLNNNASVGPNSPAGQQRASGLNENLAREVLELHTLSPAGGYTQGDVQELAKILTGWGVAMEQPPFGFLWRPQTHEPGAKSLLGRSFPEGPESQEAALRFIASRPATYRHLAVKLARHFVADDPPPEAVRALERVLRETGGDLGATYKVLVRLPQAWEPALGKLRSPQDYVIAACRACGLDAGKADMLLAGMTAINQMLWMAPQPNGWPDVAPAWATPEALMRRVDWSYTLAGRAGVTDLPAFTAAALGPLARAETVQAMRGAGSQRDAVTLLLASPEFMHR